jgi:hypothetical protein
LTVAKDGRGETILEFRARDTVPYLLLIFGIASLLTSAFYSSYVLAFIGLGLTLWGTLFLYIKSTKYVKLELLNAASSSTLQNIERILTTSGTDLKGIYLPPKNLQDNTSSLVFIPTNPNQPLPTSVDTNPHTLQSQNPLGLFITPPGLALAKLFEKELKKPFTEPTVEDLQNLLPSLFDTLQITKDFTMEAAGNTIKVEMKNHIFKDLSEETKKLEKTHWAVGSPLSSALACAFAKTTGKPLVIMTDETNPEGTTTIQYGILES